MGFGIAAGSRSVAAGATETIVSFAAEQGAFPQMWAFCVTVESPAGPSIFEVRLSESWGHVTSELVQQATTLTATGGARVMLTGCGSRFDLVIQNLSAASIEIKALASPSTSASPFAVVNW